MKVHFTGACGRAIGALALDLQGRGWSVSASDGKQYGPMDRVLREGGLEIARGYSGRYVPADAEVVVCGALVERGNPELRAARRRGIPVYNMAQFLEAYLLKRGRRIVVAGTNGKTSTTAMLAWIFEYAGKRPDYLFAGRCPHFSSSVRFRGRPLTVLEGDEYPAGLGDAGAKFLYYHPDIVLITNLVYDHAEVFSNLDEIRRQFERLVAGVPKKGRVIVGDVCGDALAVAAGGGGTVERVGRGGGVEARILRPRSGRAGMSFELDGQRFRIPVHGNMNVMNAAMAARAAAAAGVSLEESASALAEYGGVAGRLESLVDKRGGALIYDEGYHPESLRENIVAMRQRYPGRRLVVVLQPRYTGGREGFQMAALPEVLSGADRVVLLEPVELAEFEGGAFSKRLLASRLRRAGTPVHVLKRARRLPNFVEGIWKRGDVVLCSLIPECEIITEPLGDKIRALACR